MDAPTVTGRYRHDIPNDIDRLRRERPMEKFPIVSTDLAMLELRILALMASKGELPDGLALRS